MTERFGDRGIKPRSWTLGLSLRGIPLGTSRIGSSR